MKNHVTKRLLLPILAALTYLTANAFGGIVVTGTESLASLKTYVENMTIKHDGSLLSSYDQLQSIKSYLGTFPGSLNYAKLAASKYSATTVTLHASSAPNQDSLLADSYAAYNQALMWYMTGTTTYATNATNILRAWSSGSNAVTTFSGIGVNWYLGPAWAADNFAAAAELLRNTANSGSGWTSTDTLNVKNMFNNVFMPVLKWRHAYGNREFSVAKALLAIGLFNDDRAAIYMGLYHWVSYTPCYYYIATDGTAARKADYATTEPNANTYWAMHQDQYPVMGATNDWLYTGTSGYPNRPYGTSYGDDQTMMTFKNNITVADHWYMGPGINSIPNPVTVYYPGMVGETFRDLGHVDMAMCEGAKVQEMAWHQGIDLYTGFADRIVPAIELQAGFRLSNPLPAELQASGTLNATSISPTFEIAYNRYHDNLGYSMPNTEALLPIIRTAITSNSICSYSIPPEDIFADRLFSQQQYTSQWETFLFQNPPPESEIPTDGLVAYYSFENNTDDSSGYLNTGSGTSGFTYSSSAMDGVCSGTFNGTGARVVVPNSTSLQITGNLTVSAWVKANDLSSIPNVIAKSADTGYRLRINADGKPYLILGVTGSAYAGYSGASIVPTGTWTHVAATVSFSGSTSTVKFYINGVPSGTATRTTFSAIYAGTGPLVLGARSNVTSSSEAMNGLIDQVAIYNRALSAAEIGQLAQYRPPEPQIPTDGLVAYYPFENNTNDYSGYLNTGSGTSGFTYSSSAMDGVCSGTFNGTGARVVVPNSTSLQITGNLTVSAWVKANDLSSIPNVIAKSADAGYRLRINADGKLYLILGVNGSAYATYTGTSIVPTGAWTHVAATVSFSGSTSTVKFYVNGTLGGTATRTTFSAIYAGTGPLVLGARSNVTSSSEAMNGLIDGVAIYNRALSAAEIAQLAQ